MIVRRKFSSKIVLALLASALVLTACNMGAAPSPTLDINAINTAIVGTTVAQLSSQMTQTALAIPPTDTPAPTNTAMPLPSFAPATTDANTIPTVSFNVTTTVGSVVSPLPGFTQIVLSPVAPAATQALGDACNNSAFVADITIPDGTVLKGGADFEKIWRVKNTGSCTWDDGYALVYIGGSTPNLDPYNFEFKKSSDFVAGGNTADLGVKLTAPCTPGKYQGTWRLRNDQGYYFGTLLSVFIEVKEKCK